VLDVQETVFRYPAPAITLLHQRRNQAGFEEHTVSHSVVTKGSFLAVNWSDLEIDGSAASTAKIYDERN